MEWRPVQGRCARADRGEVRSQKTEVRIQKSEDRIPARRDLPGSTFPSLFAIRHSSLPPGRDVSNTAAQISWAECKSALIVTQIAAGRSSSDGRGTGLTIAEYFLFFP